MDLTARIRGSQAVHFRLRLRFTQTAGQSRKNLLTLPFS